jgi:hypothetical protein
MEPALSQGPVSRLELRAAAPPFMQIYEEEELTVLYAGARLGRACSHFFVTS